MSYNLDLCKAIPPELRVSGADSHLYRIGLSLQTTQYTNTKRPDIYNPILIFITFMANLIRNIVIISLNLNDIHYSRYYAIYLGDVDYFMETEVILNMIIKAFINA